MKIKVEDIALEGQHLSYQIDPLQWEQIASDFALLGPIQADLDIMTQGEQDAGELYVSASVSAKVQCECSRCLKPFPQSIASDFQLFYVPAPDSLPGGEYALSNDALDFHYYDGNQIVIDDELLSQLVLSIPMLPLCQNDCRGLCPRCGENLNLVSCLCRSEMARPVWADLEKFSDKEFHAKSKT